MNDKPKLKVVDHEASRRFYARLRQPSPPKPLSPHGALATLLAVTETLTVADAANAVGLTPADLIAEAEAWAAAQEFAEVEE